METVKVTIPTPFRPLLKENRRYKFYYGGRAGGKSFAFADSLLMRAREKKVFVACVREIQDSIKDSVYKLLCDRIDYYGLSDFRAYEDRISDVESRMYAYPQEIIDYLEHDPKKPYLLCEYMHDMGNSLGGMKSYMELLDRFEMYQGGFIWDYIDQALWVEDEVTGRRVLRYGGDFDDRPSDYEFSGNGILFANRSEKPAMQEVRYYYGIQNRNR